MASKVRQITLVPSLAEDKQEQAEAQELHRTIVSIDKTQQSFTLRDGECVNSQADADR